MSIRISMNGYRLHGKPPYALAVIHGGPGAAGEMKPLAEELSKITGVIEPFQSATTVQGQVEELKGQIMQSCQEPVTLVGHSWGAWLSVILTAEHPLLVKKLILVGSGPFEAKYADGIMQTRMSRLTAEEREHVSALMTKKDNDSFRQLGELLSRTDAFDPIPPEAIDVHADIYDKVWPEAAKLRQSGKLLDYAKRVRCPVLAIHGDYDPHPADGVKMPLAGAVKDFRFVLLTHCGHTPWNERQARDEFFDLIKSEL